MTLSPRECLQAHSPTTSRHVANLGGSAVFGLFVAASGVLHANPAAGEMLEAMLDAKAHESPLELFVRGILCNVLV